jgi:hypothetical protein
MVIGDEMKILEFLLELYPVFKRADIMANVQTARRPHTAENPFFIHQEEKYPIQKASS